MSVRDRQVATQNLSNSRPRDENNYGTIVETTQKLGAHQMLGKMPRGFIHNVPVYGRLPHRFQETLTKIEAHTLSTDWHGLAYIVSCDEDMELSPETPEITGGNYWYNQTEEPFTIKYADGSKEEFVIPADNKPIIYIESGLFKSEYWFAFTLIHELGHHNDPSKAIQYSKEVEIFAHTFALSKINSDNFDFLEETHPLHYNEAKEKMGDTEPSIRDDLKIASLCQKLF